MRENMRRAEAETNRLKMENLQLLSKEKEHEAFIRSMQLQSPSRTVAQAIAGPSGSVRSAASPAVGKVRSRYQLSPSGATPKRNARRPALPTNMPTNIEAASEAAPLVKPSITDNAKVVEAATVVAPSVQQPIDSILAEPAQDAPKEAPHKGSAIERARARRALTETGNVPAPRRQGPHAKRLAAAGSGPQRVAKAGPQRVVRAVAATTASVPAMQVAAAIPNTTEESPEECTSQ